MQKTPAGLPRWEEAFFRTAASTASGFFFAMFVVQLAVAVFGESERLRWLLFGTGLVLAPAAAAAAGREWTSPEAATFRIAFFPWLFLSTFVPLERWAVDRITPLSCVIMLVAYLVFCRVAPRFAERVASRCLSETRVLGAFPWLIFLFALEVTLEQWVPVDRFRYGVLPPNAMHVEAWIFGLVVLGLYSALARIRSRSLYEAAAAVLVLVALVLLLVEIPLKIELQHQNFFLAPVNDVLHGRTLLVDTASQYGVGALYFLAAVFWTLGLSPSYVGLTATTTCLLVLEYGAVYLLLRKLMSSLFLSLAALAAVLLVNYYAGFGGAGYFPAAGPLRFGLPWMLLLCLAFRIPWLALVVLGASSVWSVETFFYCAAAAGGWVHFSAVQESRGPREYLQRAAPALYWGLGTVALAHAVLWVGSSVRSGEIPHYASYLSFLMAYSPAGGVGMNGSLQWGEWIPVLLICFASVVGCLQCRRLDQSWRTAAIFAIATLGIAQFTYYLGQPHPSYLTRCAIPAVVLPFVWVDRLSSVAARSRPWFRNGLLYLLFTGLGLVFFQVHFRVLDSRSLAMEWVRTHVNHPPEPARELIQGPNCLWEPCPTSPRTRELLNLVERFSGDRHRVALFLSAENEIAETLLLARKAHEWPIGEIRQDTLVPIGMERISNHRASMKAGDPVFVDDLILALRGGTPIGWRGGHSTYDVELIARLQAKLVSELCTRFDCEQVYEWNDVNVLVLHDRRDRGARSNGIRSSGRLRVEDPGRAEHYPASFPASSRRIRASYSGESHSRGPM